LQQASLVDVQAAVIGGLVRSYVFFFVAFMQGNHPEYRFRAVQAGVGFAEYTIPMVADLGQKKPE